MEGDIVLSDEYNYFIGKREDLEEGHLDAGKRAGEACQESETFHDNFEWEDALRDQAQFSKKMGDIDKILQNCKIIKPENVVLNGRVKIGTILDLEIDGEEVSYKIGGVDTSAFEDRISYKTPLITPLLGKEIDDEIEITIAGKVKEILILDIKGFEEN